MFFLLKKRCKTEENCLENGKKSKSIKQLSKYTTHCVEFVMLETFFMENALNTQENISSEYGNEDRQMIFFPENTYVNKTGYEGFFLGTFRTNSWELNF